MLLLKKTVGLYPAYLPQINNSPHVGAEPHGSTRVSLVFTNQDGMRDREQPHQSAMLQELQNLRLIREAPAKSKNTYNHIFQLFPALLQKELSQTVCYRHASSSQKE